MALMFNAVFTTLDASSRCNPQDQTQSVACIDGQLANCRSEGGYITAACPQGQRCFALPLPNQDGISIRCENPEKADQMLGLAATTASPEPAAASSSGASVDGGGITTKSQSSTNTATIPIPTSTSPDATPSNASSPQATTKPAPEGLTVIPVGGNTGQATVTVTETVTTTVR